MLLLTALLLAFSPAHAHKGGWKCTYVYIKSDRYSSGLKEFLLSDTERKRSYQSRGHGFELSLEGERLTLVASADDETKVVGLRVVEAWGKKQQPAVLNLSAEFKTGARSTVTCK